VLKLLNIINICLDQSLGIKYYLYLVLKLLLHGSELEWSIPY